MSAALSAKWVHTAEGAIAFPPYIIDRTVQIAMIKFVAACSFAGFVIPIIFTSVWILIEHASSIGNMLFSVQLFLWPSSIFMMATAQYEWYELPALEMLAISIAVNVVLYTIIGFLLWLGLNKKRWMLYVLAVVVIIGWYRLLTL